MVGVVRGRARVVAARAVDLIGWSLGGAMALLTAAAHPDLPIGSITGLATPIDQARTPMLMPFGGPAGSPAAARWPWPPD
ncbi:hypothetical protein [Nocardia sp. MW-W600-9]